MTESAFISTLVQQAPGMAGIIAVVVLFLKAIEKRDQLFFSQMNAITDRLTKMETILVNHDAASRESYNKRSETLERIERRFSELQRKRMKAQQ